MLLAIILVQLFNLKSHVIKYVSRILNNSRESLVKLQKIHHSNSRSPFDAKSFAATNWWASNSNIDAADVPELKEQGLA